MLSEIIAGITELRKGTSREHERVDLNTPMYEMGISETDVSLLLKALYILRGFNAEPERPGLELSRMTVMQFWDFCLRDIEVENNTPKRKSNWLSVPQALKNYFKKHN